MFRLLPPSPAHSKHTAKTHYQKFLNKYSQKRNCAATVPITTFMFLWAIYIFPWSACLFCYKKIGEPHLEIQYINRSQTHNVVIGTEAKQFLFWEYINPNFFARYMQGIERETEELNRTCRLCISYSDLYRLTEVYTEKLASLSHIHSNTTTPLSIILQTHSAI